MEYSIELFINFIEKTMFPIINELPHQASPTMRPFHLSYFIFHLFPKKVPITALPNILHPKPKSKRFAKIEKISPA